MALHYSPRLRAEILARRARPSQQFGQSDDASVFGGATGCTQTVLQWIVWRVNRRWQTLDDISRAAGYPWPGSNPRRRGMTVAEVEAVIAYYRLPYEVVRDRPALEVWRASKTGLVAAAVMYSHWPEWKGYRYRGITADGQPNGYATPLRKAGKTQLSGFDGRHMTLLMGYATDPRNPDLAYCFEPNHGSGARPETPPYDRLSFAQWTTAYESYRTIGGQDTYAIVPTRPTRYR